MQIDLSRPEGARDKRLHTGGGIDVSGGRGVCPTLQQQDRGAHLGKTAVDGVSEIGIRTGRVQVLAWYFLSLVGHGRLC